MDFHQKIAKTFKRDELHYLSLGGVGEVNKNMHLYEYRGQILVVDCGIDFPDSDMPGVEIVIPDFSYLLQRQDKVLGIVITHGHEDHYGALPYLLQSLNVPIYAPRLVRGLILAKLEEFGLERKAVVHVLDPEKAGVALGPFRVTSFRVNHSVPDSCGLCLETPVGKVFHVADFKFDWTPVMDKPFDVARMLKLAEGGVLSLMSDSLGAATGGYTRSERDIEEQFFQIFSKAQRQVFLTTISSNISRMQQAINVSLKLGRKVCFLGRSIERNAQVARSLNYLKLPRKTVVKMERAMDFPQAQLTYIVTGCYGQPNSVLPKLVRRDYRYISLQNQATVVFSADPSPPGAKEHVDALVDRLTALEADVYYYDTQENLHTSGHGSAGDLLMLASLLKPANYVPIGGTRRHAQAYGHLVAPLGVEAERVFKMTPGQFLRLTGSQRAYLGEKISLTGVYVDSYGTEDLGGKILRDRKILSSDGVLVVTVALKDKVTPVSIEFSTRGFAAEKDLASLFALLELTVKRFFAESGTGGLGGGEEISQELRKELSKIVQQKTFRRPLILPVLLDV